MWTLRAAASRCAHAASQRRAMAAPCARRRVKRTGRLPDLRRLELD